MTKLVLWHWQHVEFLSLKLSPNTIMLWFYMAIMCSAQGFSASSVFTVQFDMNFLEAFWTNVLPDMFSMVQFSKSRNNSHILSVFVKNPNVFTFWTQPNFTGCFLFFFFADHNMEGDKTHLLIIYLSLICAQWGRFEVICWNKDSVLTGLSGEHLLKAQNESIIILWDFLFRGRIIIWKKGSLDKQQKYQSF